MSALRFRCTPSELSSVSAQKRDLGFPRRAHCTYRSSSRSSIALSSRRACHRTWVDCRYTHKGNFMRQGRRLMFFHSQHSWQGNPWLHPCPGGGAQGDISSAHLWRPGIITPVLRRSTGVRSIIQLPRGYGSNQSIARVMAASRPARLTPAVVPGATPLSCASDPRW